MKYLLKLLVPFAFLFLLSSCGEKDWRKEMEESQEEYLQEISKTHEFLVANRRLNYVIPNSFSSKEKALEAFFNEAIKKNSLEEITSLMSEEELRNIFYPNVLGSGTALDSNPFPQYEKTVRLRRELGFNRFKESWQDEKILKVSVEWSTTRLYGAILGHKVGSILLKGNQKTIKTEFVKMVIEHNGQFKVAVVAP